MKENVEAKLVNFFSEGKKVSYKKGEIILRAGEPIFGIYLLNEGFVRQYLISEDGDEVTIHIFRPLSFFPTMLLISNTQNRYYFEAETAVEIYRQSPEKVLEFIKTNPDVLFDLTVRFSQAVIGLSKRIETLAIGSVYAKVVSLLSYLSTRFGEEKENEIIVSIPITHNDIAAWIGAKRETISRQMEKLSRDGVIESKNHLIVIKDKQKLDNEKSRYHEEEF